MNRKVLIFILIFLSFTSIAQSTIGLPDIINYEKENYNGGTQNWDIKQDRKGIVYYANNEGLLSFDGTYWQLFPLPNKTIARSVEIGKDNKIYVGGQDEIGFFSPNQTGNLTYTSLKSLLPPGERTFADIWNISSYRNNVFFHSAKRIFQLSNNKIRVYNTEAAWLFLGISNNVLIAQNSKDGLLVFNKNNWNPLLDSKILPPGFLVTSSTSFGKDSTLLTTQRNGLYLLANNKLAGFKLSGADLNANLNFTSSVKIDEETFALGTYTNGCYIINKQGNIIQNFTGKSGLQNSNVRSLFCDRSKNIWLGLERGIDFIAFDNAIRHINPANLNDGTGYASLIYDNHLYIALSNGIYYLPLSDIPDLSYTKNEFKMIPRTEGQAWSLSLINNNLLAGRHEGLFQIKNNTATPIIKGTGFWTFQPLNNKDSALTAAGNYQGIRLLGFKNNNFFIKEPIAGFAESARFITIDSHHNIWASHPYRGVYKIQLSPNNAAKVKLYTSADGLPSALSNHVYKVRDRIVIATDKGVYEYNEETDSFKPSAFFTKIFGQTSIRYIKDDKKGNIWFINEKNLGVVDFSAKIPKIIYLPELKGKMVSGFEHVFPLGANNIFIGAEKGFYHINYEKYKQKIRDISVYIRTVEALGKTDSILFGGFANEVKANVQHAIPKVSYKSNSFHIEYSSPSYGQQSNIEYSYYLKGFDKSWSEWTKKTEKDYTNLPAGTYSFCLKARNNFGNESANSSFSFTVLPPWYQTIWAYLFYMLLTAALFYYLYKRHQKQLLLQQQKHHEEQKRLQYLHQIDLEKSEKEIVKLRNEKLETEIEFKNSELASTAMNLVQKGELLTKIKDELKRLNKNLKNPEDLDDVKKLIRILSVEEKMNEDWDQFAIHFNKVHSDFLISLKEKHPNLNAHELKLCAYLRMNLSSKEIAQLLNISVRGVEISRYRLRKKLQLPTEVNLFQFLLEIQSHKTAW